MKKYYEVCTMYKENKIDGGALYIIDTSSLDLVEANNKSLNDLVDYVTKINNMGVSRLANEVYLIVERTIDENAQNINKKCVCKIYDKNNITNKGEYIANVQNLSEACIYVQPDDHIYYMIKRVNKDTTLSGMLFSTFSKENGELKDILGKSGIITEDTLFDLFNQVVENSFAGNVTVIHNAVYNFFEWNE